MSRGARSSWVVTADRPARSPRRRRPLRAVAVARRDLLAQHVRTTRMIVATARDGRGPAARCRDPGRARWCRLGLDRPSAGHLFPVVARGRERMRPRRYAEICWKRPPRRSSPWSSARRRGSVAIGRSPTGHRGLRAPAGTASTRGSRRPVVDDQPRSLRVHPPRPSGGRSPAAPDRRGRHRGFHVGRARRQRRFLGRRRALDSRTATSRWAPVRLADGELAPGRCP